MPKLSEIFTLQMGKTPARAKNEYWNNGDNDWVSISDLSTYDKYVGETKETISDLAVMESGIKPAPADTVIMSFKLSLGKTAITVKPTYTNEAIMAFIPNGNYPVHASYFYHFFVGYDWSNGTNRAVMGATLNKATLSEIEITVPSIMEQIEIAKCLDKIDALISLRKQQLSKLDELVKSRFIEMFGDPKGNPKGYAQKQLKETCRVITGNTPSRAVDEYYGDAIEWIKTDNIVEGILYPTAATESLSEKGMAVGRTVGKDSILMACIAGSLSSIGRVCVTDRKVAFNQQINAIEPVKYNTLFLYVMLQLSKEYLIEEINMALKGILSKSKLEEKIFIVPPMDLQQQFASFVEQTDKSKLAIQHSLEKLETLKKALMQKYFG